MISGIYNIVNLIDGTIYIGSSKDCNMRWSYHRVELRSGRHCNGKLQNAWNKYGEEAFEFRVIEHCAEADLLKREQFHLDHAESSSGVVLFNLSVIARGSAMSAEARLRRSKQMKGNKFGLGYKHSESAKQKMSEQRKGIPKPESSRENYRQAALKREAARRAIPAQPYVEPEWLTRWKNA